MPRLCDCTGLLMAGVCLVNQPAGPLWLWAMWDLEGMRLLLPPVFLLVLLRKQHPVVLCTDCIARQWLACKYCRFCYTNIVWVCSGPFAELRVVLLVKQQPVILPRMLVFLRAVSAVGPFCCGMMLSGSVPLKLGCSSSCVIGLLLPHEAQACARKGPVP